MSQGLKVFMESLKNEWTPNLYAHVVCRVLLRHGVKPQKRMEASQHPKKKSSQI